MKRIKFLVASTAGHSMVKFAWNAARRACEDIARDVARANGTTLHLTSDNYVKADEHMSRSQFLSGTQVWESAQGQKLVITITRLP